MSRKPILAYYDIRGRAQPIRNLLVFAGVEFEDKYYPFGPGKSVEDWDSVAQHWNDEKSSLGLDFPHLPYLVDGEVKLTQTIAILRYLARKYGLIAKDNVTLAKQEMLEQQIYEYIEAVYQLAYSGNYAADKQTFVSKTLPDNLAKLGTYLGTKEWFTGQLSYVDMLAHEVLCYYRYLSPRLFGEKHNLVNFMARYENLPRIKEYLNTSKYKSWQINASVANEEWGKNFKDK